MSFIYKYMVKIVAFFYLNYRLIKLRFKNPEDYDEYDLYLVKIVAQEISKKRSKL